MEVDGEDSDVDIDICCTDDEDTIPFPSISSISKSNDDGDTSVTSCSTPMSTDMNSRSNSPTQIMTAITETDIETILKGPSRLKGSSARYHNVSNQSNARGSVRLKRGTARSNRSAGTANSRTINASNTKEGTTVESNPSDNGITKKEAYLKSHELQSDSSDEEMNEGTSSRFYFESDHLALKKNKDYQLLLKTLVVLEAQRSKAVSDLEKLGSLKEKALQDPVAFVDALQAKTLPEFPKHQAIAKHPDIDFTHYLVAYSNLKLPKGGKINTRRSMKDIDQDSEKEAVEDLRSGVSENRLADGDLLSSKIWDENKPSSVSQLWTNEEQERLEKLLHVYPPEEIETRRWSKIADALGNRTAIQVASRVQKYFIKLAKAGLPVPGRVPSIHNLKKAKANRINYRNSTFFPSWRPHVYMNDDDDDSSSLNSFSTQSGNADNAFDDIDIPAELQDSEEYKELMELKRIRRGKSKEKQQTIHRGYMCDYCGMEPIVGKRWHCVDCGDQDSIDLCDNCAQSKPCGIANHTNEHRLIEISKEPTFLDDDYLRFEQISGDYNYLDSNFKPSGK